MALAERTRHAPTPEERGVDARLADALDDLLGALDGLPASEQGDEARLQSQLPYNRGHRLRKRSFLSLLGPPLRYSRRLPYRIARLVLPYGRGQAGYRLQERSFLSLLSPRLRYSRRLPYRIARLVLVLWAAAGLAMILVRFLAHG
jgi:hypothetical protein